MITIRGSKSTRHGNAAAQNMRKQLGHLLRHAPYLEGIHLGTINVELVKALIVVHPDTRTPPITWQEQNPNEVFDILKITFESKGEPEPVPCWLYIAHQSPHRRDLRNHEIIAQRRLQIDDGETCSIHIDRDAAELPYVHLNVVVI